MAQLIIGRQVTIYLGLLIRIQSLFTPRTIKSDVEGLLSGGKVHSAQAWTGPQA